MPVLMYEYIFSYGCLKNAMGTQEVTGLFYIRYFPYYALIEGTPDVKINKNLGEKNNL